MKYKLLSRRALYKFSYICFSRQRSILLAFPLLSSRSYTVRSYGRYIFTRASETSSASATFFTDPSLSYCSIISRLVSVVQQPPVMRIFRSFAVNKEYPFSSSLFWNCLRLRCIALCPGIQPAPPGAESSPRSSYTSPYSEHISSIYDSGVRNRKTTGWSINSHKNRIFHPDQCMIYFDYPNNYRYSSKECLENVRIEYFCLPNHIFLTGFFLFTLSPIHGLLLIKAFQVTQLYGHKPAPVNHLDNESNRLHLNSHFQVTQACSNASHVHLCPPSTSFAYSSDSSCFFCLLKLCFQISYSSLKITILTIRRLHPFQSFFEDFDFVFPIMQFPICQGI